MGRQTPGELCPDCGADDSARCLPLHGPLGQLSVGLAVWAHGVNVQPGCVPTHLGVGVLVDSETNGLGKCVVTTTNTRANVS